MSSEEREALEKRVASAIETAKVNGMEDPYRQMARAAISVMGDEREIWVRAWLAVAATFNAKERDCTRYADACVLAYHERFGTTPRA